MSEITDIDDPWCSSTIPERLVTEFWQALLAPPPLGLCTFLHVEYPHPCVLPLDGGMCGLLLGLGLCTCAVPLGGGGVTPPPTPGHVACFGASLRDGKSGTQGQDAC